MHISVIIPFRDRGDLRLLHWTLEGYAGQKLAAGHTLEVLVGNDGAEAPALAGLNTPPSIRISAHGFPRIGAAAVRNHLAEKVSAQTQLLVFGNADARPATDMVQQHATAMASLPPGSMVLGSAPWEKPPAPTVFDVLLTDSPMVFFYNQLKPNTWYDFRHAWTLNLSVRLSDFQTAGGFCETLRPVYYEDLALGFRLLGPEKKGILYHPAAQVLHRHPTTLEQYLDREELLGLMAPVLARAVPEAFAALFGTRDAAALAPAYQNWLALDRPMHQWIYRRLQEWAALPERALGDGEQRQRTLMAVYQMHIPLKRLAFRLGFIKGLALAGDERWQERKPEGLWRAIVAS